MHPRTCIALLTLLSACATTELGPGELMDPSPRVANLQRAAQYPWTDDGHCVVREASNEWPILAERCYHALEHDRVKFRDVTGRCAVASTAAVAMGVGLCVFLAPEIMVGAIIVTGVVVVAAVIQEELDAYERNASRERAKPEIQTGPTKEPLASGKPKPEESPLGRDWLPPTSSDPRERPECRPIPGPPRGGNDPHNECANKIAGNNFPGLNVFVNGKHFDALVLATRTLWEVKTDNFDIHSPHSQKFFIRVKLPELRREARLAKECGYEFIVGVRSEAHKIALERADGSLKVVVMDWC